MKKGFVQMVSTGIGKLIGNVGTEMLQGQATFPHLPIKQSHPGITRLSMLLISPLAVEPIKLW